MKKCLFVQFLFVFLKVALKNKLLLMLIMVDWFVGLYVCLGMARYFVRAVLVQFSINMLLCWDFSLSVENVVPFHS